MQPAQQPVSIPCKRCGAPVTVLATFASMLQDKAPYCLQCGDELRRSDEATRANEEAQARFIKLCPPCFEDTDEGRLPCRQTSSKALKWKYGPRGVVMFGDADTGKSRTASLMVRREVFKGRTVAALAPGDFIRELQARKFTPAPYLLRLSRCDLLFLDDIGQWRLYLPQEQHLFSVLNARAGRRPTIVTCNQTGAELALKFKTGEPLIRRIRDFSEHVHFRKASV